MTLRKMRLIPETSKGPYMGPPLPLRPGDGQVPNVMSFGKAVMVHVAIAERALGKPLPARAEVHHVDRDRNNNAASNLVICQDRAYHSLLHRRMRAMAATGNPDALLCQVCSSYDDQPDMRDYNAGRGQRFRIHGKCMKIRNAANKQRRKLIRHEKMTAAGYVLNVSHWVKKPTGMDQAA